MCNRDVSSDQINKWPKNVFLFCYLLVLFIRLDACTAIEKQKYQFCSFIYIREKNSLKTNKCKNFQRNAWQVIMWEINTCYSHQSHFVDFGMWCKFRIEIQDSIYHPFYARRIDFSLIWNTLFISPSNQAHFIWVNNTLLLCQSTIVGTLGNIWLYVRFEPDGMRISLSFACGKPFLLIL